MHTKYDDDKDYLRTVFQYGNYIKGTVGGTLTHYVVDPVMTLGLFAKIEDINSYVITTSGMGANVTVAKMGADERKQSGILRQNKEVFPSHVEKIVAGVSLDALSAEYDSLCGVYLEFVVEENNNIPVPFYTVVTKSYPRNFSVCPIDLTLSEKFTSPGSVSEFISGGKHEIGAQLNLTALAADMEGYPVDRRYPKEEGTGITIMNGNTLAGKLTFSVVEGKDGKSYAHYPNIEGKQQIDTYATMEKTVLEGVELSDQLYTEYYIGRPTDDNYGESAKLLGGSNTSYFTETINE